ncbi:SAM-dependent methyltransferase, partial [Mycobacterium tuberculosis]
RKTARGGGEGKRCDTAQAGHDDGKNNEGPTSEADAHSGDNAGRAAERDRQRGERAAQDRADGGREGEDRRRTAEKR